MTSREILRLCCGSPNHSSVPWDHSWAGCFLSSCLKRSKNNKKNEYIAFSFLFPHLFLTWCNRHWLPYSFLIHYKAGDKGLIFRRLQSWRFKAALMENYVLVGNCVHIWGNITILIICLWFRGTVPGFQDFVPYFIFWGPQNAINIFFVNFVFVIVWLYLEALPFCINGLILQLLQLKQGLTLDYFF